MNFLEDGLHGKIGDVFGANSGTMTYEGKCIFNAGKIYINFQDAKLKIIIIYISYGPFIYFIFFKKIIFFTCVFKKFKKY